MQGAWAGRGRAQSAAPSGNWSSLVIVKTAMKVVVVPLVLLAAACSGSSARRSVPAPVTPVLVGVWRPVRIAGYSGPLNLRRNLDPGVVDSNLRFTRSSLRAGDGCHPFGGSYKVGRNGAFSVSELATPFTGNACSVTVPNIRVVTSAVRVSRRGNELRFFDRKGAELGVYAKVPSSSSLNAVQGAASCQFPTPNTTNVRLVAHGNKLTVTWTQLPSDVRANTAWLLSVRLGGVYELGFEHVDRGNSVRYVTDIQTAQRVKLASAYIDTPQQVSMNVPQSRLPKLEVPTTWSAAVRIGSTTLPMCPDAVVPAQFPSR